MIRNIKELIWKLLIKLGIGGPVQLLLTGYLKETGWYISFNTKNSIDYNSRPIPWCTYPFVEFIGPRLNKYMVVFEYGSGNSTMWYAQKVLKIIAVEHNKDWSEQIARKLPLNAKVLFRSLEEGNKYVHTISDLDTKFDIVIIDGRNRVECVNSSMDFLKDNGVIVFDNSNLEIYTEAIELLKNRNFKQLDFIGMSPITPHTNCTSIFYRCDNCLNI